MMIRNRKRVSAVLATALSALALTAITASSAQAAGNGLWLVNLAVPGFPTAVTGHTAEKNSLLSGGVTFSCTLASFSGNLTASTHAKGKATFTGCSSNAEPACLLVNSKKEMTKEIATNEVLAELLLLGTVVRFKPLTGTIFASALLLSQDSDCVAFLTEHTTLNITGETCAAVSADTIRLLLKTELDQVMHCPNGLKLGGNTAHISEDKPLIVKSGTSKVTTRA